MKANKIIFEKANNKTTDMNEEKMNCSNCMFSKKDAEYDNIILCSKILEGVQARDEHVNETEIVVDKNFCCIFWLPLFK